MNRTDVCPEEFAPACAIDSIRQTLLKAAL